MNIVDLRRRQLERRLRIRERSRAIGKVRQPPSKAYSRDLTPRIKLPSIKPTPRINPIQPIGDEVLDLFFQDDYVDEENTTKNKKKRRRPTIKKITKFEFATQNKFPNEIIDKYKLSNELIKDIEKKLTVIDYRKNIPKHNKDLISLAKKVCKDKINQDYITKIFKKDKNNYYGTMVYYNDILLGFTNYYRKPKEEMFFINLICVNKKEYLKGLPLGKILIDLVIYESKKYEKKTKKIIRRIRLQAIPEAVDFYKQYGFYETGRGFSLKEMDYIIH